METGGAESRWEWGGRLQSLNSVIMQIEPKKTLMLEAWRMAILWFVICKGLYNSILWEGPVGSSSIKVFIFQVAIVLVQTRVHGSGYGEKQLYFRDNLGGTINRLWRCTGLILCIIFLISHFLQVHSHPTWASIMSIHQSTVTVKFIAFSSCPQCVLCITARFTFLKSHSTDKLFCLKFSKSTQCLQY